MNFIAKAFENITQIAKKSIKKQEHCLKQRKEKL